MISEMSPLLPELPKRAVHDPVGGRGGGALRCMAWGHLGALTLCCVRGVDWPGGNRHVLPEYEVRELSCSDQRYTIT